MRSFLVVAPADDRESALYWPWLNILPSAWRRSASAWAPPKCLPALATEDGSVTGHALATIGAWPLPKTVAAILDARRRIAPDSLGWAGAEPPLVMPGVFWRRGRIVTILAALGAFRAGRIGNPAGLTVMLSGAAQAEYATAARYLAGTVRRLILVHPGGNFRQRLAAQILSEWGLAVVSRSAPAAGGWDVALDLGGDVPRLSIGGRLAEPRIVFPRPLLSLGDRQRFGNPDHPVWDECHLACLMPEGKALPPETSLAALRAAFDLAERAELEFTLS